jgi:hypothetical protein
MKKDKSIRWLTGRLVKSTVAELNEINKATKTPARQSARVLKNKKMIMTSIEG